MPSWLHSLWCYEGFRVVQSIVADVRVLSGRGLVVEDAIKRVVLLVVSCLGLWHCVLNSIHLLLILQLRRIIPLRIQLYARSQLRLLHLLRCAQLTTRLLLHLWLRSICANRSQRDSRVQEPAAAPVSLHLVQEVVGLFRHLIDVFESVQAF